LGEPFYSHTMTSRLEVTDDLLDRVREVAEGVGARVASAESVEGPPAARIVEFAHHGSFELIVMGTRRRGRLQSALLGSVSAAVAAHSSVPVMIVPERASGVNDSGMGI
jgi:nucleotide-binding universal stress UspA family protein